VDIFLSRMVAISSPNSTLSFYHIYFWSQLVVEMTAWTRGELNPGEPIVESGLAAMPGPGIYYYIITLKILYHVAKILIKYFD